MSAILGTLLKVDVSKVSTEVQEGLRTGKMMLSASNGNVYWAAGSGGQGIVAHLPLVPVSPQELASAEQLLQIGQAVQGAKVAAMTATAVGTAVVVVAVVVATAYLAGKIDKVQRAIDTVAQTVAQQDQREYLRHLSDYTGAVMAAQELLHARAPQSELAGMAELRIDKLAESRQQVLRFIRGLQPLMSSSAQTTEAQYDLALQFMVSVLDLVPHALAVERELCLAARRPALAKSRRDQAAPEFRRDLADFRAWCEGQYRQLALGQGRFADVLQAKREMLNGLFHSPVHDLLLDGLEAALTRPTTRPGGESEAAAHRAMEAEAPSRGG